MGARLGAVRPWSRAHGLHRSPCGNVGKPPARTAQIHAMYPFDEKTNHRAAADVVARTQAGCHVIQLLKH